MVLAACKGYQPAPNALKPDIVTQATPHDTDDPAIWINRANPAESLIIGTDKDTDGGLYVYDLLGNIDQQCSVKGLKRPNNVDIAYGLIIAGKPVDIAVATERERNVIRIFSLPDMKPLDNGGIPVFEGDSLRDPMGIALYTRPSDSAIFAIVGRKTGPAEGYLWQYQLKGDSTGLVKAELVRKFGSFSGKKEIESIAVDNELGYIYYSDEGHGVHKYYADPAKGNAELALFGQQDFKEDLEGISIYKSTDSTGYILVSNQQDGSFVVYPREGAKSNAHEHKSIATIPFSTHFSDGSDVTNVNLGAAFPKGVFVAMSEGKVFHYYDWRKIEERMLQK